jgi:indolepyruvate ferredoxin oxidoreductase
VKHSDWHNPAEACLASISQAVAAQDVGLLNAETMARTLMGDALYINPLLLGYAWQRGWIPLRWESLMRAMELNGVAVEANKTAFAWGRQAAHDNAFVQRLLTPDTTITLHRKAPLAQTVARRVEYLTAYQHADYAKTYQQWVEKVQAAEATKVAQVGGGRTTLAETVAQVLFKLMAYKDEYEVARLHLDARFEATLAAQFEPGFVVQHHLAAPLLARKNARGEGVKQAYGASSGATTHRRLLRHG